MVPSSYQSYHSCDLWTDPDCQVLVKDCPLYVSTVKNSNSVALAELTGRVGISGDLVTGQFTNANHDKCYSGALKLWQTLETVYTGNLI